jgi:hypothetical protein
LWHCPSANAQTQDDARAKEIESLRNSMQGMEKSMQEMRAKLSELEKQTPGATNAVGQTTNVPSSTMGGNQMYIADQKINLPAVPGTFGDTNRSPVRDYDTFNDLQPAAPRPDNLPIDPALKGFIPLPGTQTMIRFGGSARIDGIYDFQDNGNPNQFMPSSFPVAGQPGASGGPNTTIETKGTRISFEARRPAADTGGLRIFNENDFFGDSTTSSMSFRVRHFYGQAWNVLIGQTYTAFMNVDSWPDVVDYAGPNAMINRRQPQLRYSPPIYEGVGKMNLLFSVEQPTSEVSTTATGIPAGAQAVTRLPDGVLGWRWEGSAGNVQLSGLFRSVGYDSGAGPSSQNVFGWGVNGSGAFNVFEKDKLSWQAAYGEGMARYVNDLGGQNLDAAPDSSGNLKAIPALATMAGYTHQWAKDFRSTASFGYVYAEPPSSLGPFAIERTEYASLNLIWHPTSSFRMGLEYLFGHKETQGGADHDGSRLDFVLRYDLIR